MKTGTIKTLGAAALGVAFAAAAAGSANAAETVSAPALPTALPAADPAAALSRLTTQLPVDQVARAVPGGQQAADAIKGAAGTVSGVTPSLTHAVPGGTGHGLLGGLPLAGNGIGNGTGTGLNGLPLG